MALVQWLTGVSGEWTAGANWAGNAQPGLQDDASLAVAGSYVVSLSSSVGVAGLVITNPDATLSLQDGAALAVTGDLADSGTIDVDTNYAVGGSALTVDGTLTDSGALNIGGGTLSASTTVTVGALVDTGTLTISGNGANQAALVVGAAAPATLATTVSLNGDALLQYASGGITTIASGGQLNLSGDARVADASAASTNSALTGLATVAGTLSLQGGASVDVTGDLADSGTIDVDTNYAVGGSALTVDGTLTDSGALNIGGGTLSASTTVTVGALVDTGALTIGGNGANQAALVVGAAAPATLATTVSLNGDALLQYASGEITTIASTGALNLSGDARVAEAGAASTNSALAGLATVAGTLSLQNGASVAVTGDLADSGTIYVDTSYAVGGSALTVDGTLTDSGALNIGGGTLSASTTVTVGALVDTGALTIGGNGANQAALVVGAAAPTTLATTVSLNGDALLQYASGGITTIASGGQLNLSGDARVADASAASTNSALTGLATVAGTLSLQGGASVDVTGDLADSGTIDVDTNYAVGGSALTVDGTLTDSGALNIGGGTLSASTTVTVGALVDTGTLTISGNGANQAALVVGAAAPATLATTVSLNGDALLQYASGGITTIASGGQLNLSGDARVADASAASTNSALTGLATVAGTLSLQGGASVDVTGDLADSGTIDVDTNYAVGGSALTVDGTLTDSGALNIGGGTLSASTTVTVGALVDTGTLTISGNGANQAALVVGAAAPATLATTVSLNGDALLQYASGGITTIASGGQLNLSGDARVADASAASTNSALTGLATVAGTLSLQGGASVDVTGDLADSGTIDVDTNYAVGGSALTVDGTLTDSGALNIGGGTLSASTTVTVGALVDTGTLTISGNGANQAALVVGAAAPATLATTVSLNGDALLQYASGGITTIASTGALNLSGDARVAEAGAASTNSALAGLATVAGTLSLQNGASVAVTGDLADSGTIYVDTSYAVGGSALTVNGTLTDSGALNIGGGTLSASTTVTVGALVDTGALTIGGNGANQAALVVGAAAPATLATTVSLNGDALLQYASGEITTIASTGALYLPGTAHVADAGATSTNSALTGLATVAGTLSLQYGATDVVTGDLADSGTIAVDTYGYAGGSALTVAGTLTDSGTLTIGTNTLTASTAVTVGALVDTGALTVGEGSVKQTTLLVKADASNAGSVTINGGGAFDVTGAYTQTGDTSDFGNLSAVQLTLTAGMLDGVGSVTGAVVNTGATLLGGQAGYGPGTLAITGSYQQSAAGVLLEDLNAGSPASEVTVSGAVALRGGTLNVETTNGFTLAAGQSFTVLTAAPGGLSGAFAAVSYNGATGNGAVDIGGGLYLETAYDDAAGTVKLDVVQNPLPPPVITAPTALRFTGDAPEAITGLSVTAQTPGPITVELLDQSGSLNVGVEAGVTLTGGGGALTLTGAAAAVSEDLATLVYTPGAATSDTLSLVATDASGQTSYDQVALDVANPPTIGLPATPVTEAPGQADPLTGITVADPSLAAADGTLTVSLTDAAGLLAATASGGAAVAGDDSTRLTLTGSVASVQATLASLTFGGSASDSLTIAASDGLGGAASAVLAVTVSPPPVLTAPAAPQDGFNGAAALLGGLSVSVPGGAPAGLVLVVTVASSGGTLDVPAGTAAVTGQGAAKLTLTGSLTAINTALTGLSFSGPDTGSAETITLSTPDGTGGVVAASVHVNLTKPPPPVVTVPESAANAGVLTPIDGVKVADGAGVDPNTPITTVLTDTAGLLDLQGAPSAATVSGRDTTSMTITGTAAEVDADLGRLTFYVADDSGSSELLDTITVHATADGMSSSASILVGNSLNRFVAPVTPETPPGILDYTGALPASLASTVGGYEVSNGYLHTIYLGLPPSGTALQFALGGYNANTDSISVGIQKSPDFPDIGFSGLGGGPLEGLAPDSLGYLLTAIDEVPRLGDQITYIIGGSSGSNNLLPDERVTLMIGGGPPPGSSITANGGFGGPNGPGGYHGGGGGVVTTCPTTPISTGGGGGGADDDGDVHLTTFDGLHYDFQAVGEFVLAKSTAPGDTFEVQIRTQPYYNSSAASVTTALAAEVGAHRVTFDLFRDATVWVDGHAVALAVGGAPLDLGAGTVRALTADSWEVRFDSGEALVVTKDPSFLDVHLTLTPRAQPGTVEGLLGNDTGNLANTFTLPDGAVLAQPLSYDALYTQWAGAWRVTQASSLLDYGAGQTTASFTDLSFPQDAIPLSSFPAAEEAQAAALVAAAGITNPAIAQGATEDYLLTGDTSFITSAAIEQTTTNADAIAPAPASPGAPGGVGIATALPVVTAAAAGPTSITLTIYRTGGDAAAQTVDYQVQSPGAGFLGAADFGGALPAGQVTIAAGQSSGTLVLQVTGSLGTAPDAKLQVAINTGATGAPVLAPVVVVDLVNSAPVAGAAADPVFEQVSPAGTLSQTGNAYTLALGAFSQDAAAPQIQEALANLAPTLADALSGQFTVATPDGIRVASGTGPVTDLLPGGRVGVDFAVNTSSLGSFSETITFMPNESNGSGYQAALPELTLTVTDSVVAPPSGSVTSVVAFGAVHAGAAAQRAVTVTNTGSTVLDATAVASAAATASGAVSGLAPAGTDSTSLVAGLNTALDGPQSGLLTVTFAPPGGTGDVSGVLLQPASITGSGAFAGAASLLDDGAVPKIGSAASAAAVVSWGSADTAFTFDLGHVTTLTDLLASVGAGDAYTVAVSTDGVTYTNLLTIPALQGSGLQTVATQADSPYHLAGLGFAPVQSRYVRLQAAPGDGHYAAGELDLFTAPATVAVSGTVYTEAAPVVTAPAIVVHVGDPGTFAVTLANAAAADGYGETLDSSLGSVTGGFAAGNSGAAQIAPGAHAALNLSFSTAQAGQVSGAATVVLASDGGTGVGSLDGLGQTTLESQTVTLAATVDAYADPVFAAVSGPGTLTQTAAGATLDLGTIRRGAAAVQVGFAVANGASEPADLLSGSLSATGAGAFTTSGMAAFTGLTAGQQDAAPTVTLSAAAAGSFTETITLHATGSNASGYTGALHAQTLTVTGTVTDAPPVLSAPATLFAMQGSSVALTGVSLAEVGAASGETFTVTLADATGRLSATGAGVSGASSTSLTIGGSLTQVNAALATLTDIGSAGTDTITLNADDSFGTAAATRQIAVTAAGGASVTGAAGAAGGTGAPGSAGQPADADAGSPASVENAADGTGGAGGAGGVGSIAATNPATGHYAGPGGRAGAGADGGNAVATATTAISTASAPATATGTAVGGAGGAAGAPGLGSVAGRGNSGGAGGHATAEAGATNTAGDATATATSTAGTGGDASGAGGAGGGDAGAGGSASGSFAAASGLGSAAASVDQTGGTGGVGSDGANGGAGGASTLSNAVSGQTNGGTLTLYQNAAGGDGGDSDTGLGGAGGAASSTLTFPGMPPATSSAVVDATVLAAGGNAGNGFAYPPGGAAAVTATLTDAGDINAKGDATGGMGGGGGAGTGGAASATMHADAGGQASTEAVSHGGAGGSSTFRNGGTGGGSRAAASALGNKASALAFVSGGQGGNASGAGKTAGVGGTASGASAGAAGINAATASVIQTGGYGGAGSQGAAGGNGAGSTLVNAVTGSTDGGALTLNQTAQGGVGGDGDTGPGGRGGYAISRLTFADSTNPTASASITATITGAGGNGANMGAVAGDGGSTWDAGTVTGAGHVSLETQALGGNAGPGGAQGGAAEALAAASGAVVNSTAVADGGVGQVGAGIATAVARGTGVSGTVTAAAETGLQSGNLVENVASDATEAVGGAASAVAQASIGDPAAPFTSGTAAIIAGAPAAGSVAAVLAAEPTIASALGQGGTSFALGEVGGGHSATGMDSQTSTGTVAVTVDLLQLSAPQDLFLSFYEPRTAGAGISGVGLSVTANGANILTEAFSTVGAATAWFADHPIDMGSFASGSLASASSLDLQVALSVTTTRAGGSFETGLLISNQRGQEGPSYLTVPH